MRVYKDLFKYTNIYFRTKKKSFMETIDFNYEPNKIVEMIILKPTNFKPSKVPYEQQYESRDFEKSKSKSP